MKDSIDLILNHNKHLPLEGRMEKYRAIQQSPFRFFRGTCHLFYERLALVGPPKDHTEVWICGDLHVENFGSFKGENRLVYFDLNDFDEAVLAPLSFEVLRFATSVLIAADLFGFRRKEAKNLAFASLNRYRDALLKSKALMVERETANGLMLEFLKRVASRKRQEFIAGITKPKGEKREFLIDNVHRTKLKPDLRRDLLSWCKEEMTYHEKLKHLDIVDCVHRIAGTGSLGCLRYEMLAADRKTGKLYLLDMKEAWPSSLLKQLKTKQPKWSNEADRVVSIQQRLQYCAPALLCTARFNKQWFVLRELQPGEDKVDLAAAKGNERRLEEIILPMAELAAYAHLRGTGRQGSSTADQLSEAVSGANWAEKRSELSEELASLVIKDYENFQKYSLP